jgi:hypothetical protein
MLFLVVPSAACVYGGDPPSQAGTTGNNITSPAQLNSRSPPPRQDTTDRRAGHVAPKLIADLGDAAAWRYVEFLTGHIGKSAHTPSVRASCRRFFVWCDHRSLALTELRRHQPLPPDESSSLPRTTRSSPNMGSHRRSDPSSPTRPVVGALGTRLRHDETSSLPE